MVCSLGLHTVNKAAKNEINEKSNCQNFLTDILRFSTVHADYNVLWHNFTGINLISTFIDYEGTNYLYIQVYNVTKGNTLQENCVLPGVWLVFGEKRSTSFTFKTGTTSLLSVSYKHTISLINII